MKTNLPCEFSGPKSFWLRRATGLPLAASLFIAVSLAGQLVAPPKSGATVPATKEKILEGKVMAELPRYGDVPVAVEAAKPASEPAPEIVSLVPLVIVGDRGPKLREPELRTKKAFAADLLRQYDYSAFSLFQHREDLRLQDMAALQTYADSLMLIGDVEDSRAIRKESNRLFFRPRNSDSEYIDTLLNPRVR